MSDLAQFAIHCVDDIIAESGKCWWHAVNNEAYLSAAFSRWCVTDRQSEIQCHTSHVEGRTLQCSNECSERGRQQTW